MTEELTVTPIEVTPIQALDDARVVNLLNAELSSLVANRTLAYNEALTRAGMFLAFLSMSFVGLALVGQGIGFGDQFLVVAALILAFDLIVGLTTYGRIVGANHDDLRAVHAMARVRHASVRVAPVIAPFIANPTNDDLESLMEVYGGTPGGSISTLAYALTTSGGMIGLITSMVGGVLVGTLALAAGLVSGLAVVLVGIAGGLVVFTGLAWATMRYVPNAQARLGAAFPAHRKESA